MRGLARTTPETLILIGAEVGHHPGLIRPNSFLPLPKSVTTSAGLLNHVESSILIQNIRPQRHSTRSRAKKTAQLACSKNVDAARKTLKIIKAFDADDRVLVVLSHDRSLRGVVPIFTARAHLWAEKEWKQRIRWEFLSEFCSSRQMNSSLKESLRMNVTSKVY
jgi:hypothetical protein